MKRITVWDLPLRIFHWLLFALVVAGSLTAMVGGNWMNWHGRIGVAVVGLLAFRLVWGFVGSTTARFAHFVRGPRAIRDYLGGRWQGVGHNPLGALSVLGMLVVLSLQVGTGLFANDDIGFNAPLYSLVSKETSDWLAGLHKKNAWLLGVLVATHLAAILYYVRIRKETLIMPMIVGTLEVSDERQESLRGGRLPAFVLAAIVGIAASWVASGGLLPPPPPAAAPGAAQNW